MTPRAIAFATTLLLAGCSTPRPSPPGTFDWSLLSGQWAESTSHQYGCRPDNLHQRFEVSPDGKTLTFLNDRPWPIGTGQTVERYSASIVDAMPHALVLRYGDDLPGLPEEMRQWEMRFIGPGTYRWRATAWSPTQYNNVIGVRCGA